MEFLNINLAAAGAMGVFAMAIVEWYKTDTMPKWAVRLSAFGVSFALVALVTDWSIAFNLQEFLKMGIAVGGIASGIWHGTKEVGVSIARANNPQ